MHRLPLFRLHVTKEARLHCLTIHHRRLHAVGRIRSHRQLPTTRVNQHRLHWSVGRLLRRPHHDAIGRRHRCRRRRQAAAGTFLRCLVVLTNSRLQQPIVADVRRLHVITIRLAAEILHRLHVVVCRRHRRRHRLQAAVGHQHRCRLPVGYMTTSATLRLHMIMPRLRRHDVIGRLHRCRRRRQAAAGMRLRCCEIIVSPMFLILICVNGHLIRLHAAVDQRRGVVEQCALEVLLWRKTLALYPIINQICCRIVVVQLRLNRLRHVVVRRLYKHRLQIVVKSTPRLPHVAGQCRRPTAVDVLMINSDRRLPAARLQEAAAVVCRLHRRRHHLHVLGRLHQRKQNRKAIVGIIHEVISLLGLKEAENQIVEISVSQMSEVFQARRGSVGMLAVNVPHRRQREVIVLNLLIVLLKESNQDLMFHVRLIQMFGILIIASVITEVR